MAFFTSAVFGRWVVLLRFYSSFVLSFRVLFFGKILPGNRITFKHMTCIYDAFQFSLSLPAFRYKYWIISMGKQTYTRIHDYANFYLCCYKSLSLSLTPLCDHAIVPPYHILFTCRHLSGGALFRFRAVFVASIQRQIKSFLLFPKWSVKWPESAHFVFYFCGRRRIKRQSTQKFSNRKESVNVRHVCN